MDQLEEVTSREIVKEGFNIISKDVDTNKIIEKLMQTNDIEEQRTILKYYLKNISTLSEEKILELSEALLFMAERTTLQKSLMLGYLKDDNKIFRTKKGLKIINSDNQYVTIPYSKITNEVIGKDIAKRIRKVM